MLPSVLSANIEVSLAAVAAKRSAIAVLRELNAGIFLRIFNNHVQWFNCNWDAPFLPCMYVGLISESIFDQPNMPVALHNLLTNLKMEQDELKCTIQLSANTGDTAHEDRVLSPRDWLLLGSYLGIKLPTSFVDSSNKPAPEAAVEGLAYQHYRAMANYIGMMNDQLMATGQGGCTSYVSNESLDKTMD